MKVVWIAAVMAVMGLGCGSAATTPDSDPPGADAAGADADVIDAAVFDAAPDDARPATPGRELVGGHGRVSGGSITMEVQVGHGLSQAPTVKGTTTLQGAAAVKK